MFDTLSKRGEVKFNVGNKVRELSSELHKTGFKITYNAKKDIYSLFDVKYDHIVHSFSSNEDLAKTSSHRIKAILDRYIGSEEFFVAIHSCYDKIRKSIKELFGIDLYMTDEKIVLEKRDKRISFSYENAKLIRMSDIKVEVIKRMHLLG